MKIDLATGMVLMCTIIAAGSIGMCAFAIWLYHRDGGQRSTKTIVLNALGSFFAPLISIWTWIRR